MSNPVSDDLVERLRSRKGEAITRVERLMDEAATHIEEAAAQIAALSAERDDLAEKARRLEFADIHYRTWREFYGALLATPPDGAIPLEVRAHRQARIIASMQYRLRCLRQEIRRHLKRDPLEPVKGYRIGLHVNKLHALWRASEARADAAEAQLKAARDQVEQAFKDGAHYATMVKVKNTDEAREEAWLISRAHAALNPKAPS